jgi:hypothetical protein
LWGCDTVVSRCAAAVVAGPVQPLVRKHGDALSESRSREIVEREGKIRMTMQTGRMGPLTLMLLTSFVV